MIFLVLTVSALIFLDICLMIASGRNDRAEEKAKEEKEREGLK